METIYIVRSKTYYYIVSKCIFDWYVFSFIEEREILNAKQKAESYTESSINAFKTILRVKTDWETLNEMAQTSTMGKFILHYTILFIL